MLRVNRLDWLETFVAVVEHAGFTAASEALHRSQSRVSAHVAELEQAVGAPLFDRRHRPVVLTDAGEALLDHARAILVHLEAGQSEVDAVRGLTRGQVVLGSYPSASAAFLPGLLREFGDRYPGVQVALVEQPMVDLAASLLAGDLHLALRPLVPAADDLASIPLWREWLVAVVPTGHELAALPEPVALDRVAEYPLITMGRRGISVQYEAQKAFRAAGLEPEINWQTDQPQTLVSLVRSGLGVGVGNQLAPTVAETSDLDVVRIGELEQGREVAVLWDDRRHQSVATRALRQAILETPPPDGTVPATRE